MLENQHKLNINYEYKIFRFFYKNNNNINFDLASYSLPHLK